MVWEQEQPFLEKGIVMASGDIFLDFYTCVTYGLAKARELNPKKPLQLRITSDGGSAMYAMALVEWIEMDGNIQGVLLGRAGSAAGVIWAACKERYAGPNSMLGIHQCGMPERETHSVFESDAFGMYDLMNSVNHQMARIYERASNKNRMWWLTGLKKTRNEFNIFDFDTLVGLGMCKPLSELK